MNVPDEMMVRYFERRKRDLEECVHHLQKGDLNFIEKVGHQLKGNGVTFGYPELSEIGSELERAARDRNDHELTSALGKFSHWVEIHLS